MSQATDGPFLNSELIARHRSPDGALTLRVHRTTEPDGSLLISVGFEESSWHIHPELFSAEPPEEKALSIVDDVIHDRMVIVIDRTEDTRISLLDTIEQELEIPGQEFRFWGGRVIDRAELLEGSIVYKPL